MGISHMPEVVDAAEVQPYQPNPANIVDASEVQPYQGERPGIPRPPLPLGLMSPEQERAELEKRYGQAPIERFAEPILRYTLDPFISGVERMRGGVEAAAEPAQASLEAQGRQALGQPTGITPAQASATLRQAAGAAHEVIGGGFEAATPLVAGELAASPIATGVTLGGAAVADWTVRNGLQALGLPEEYSNVAGDLAAVIAGGLTKSAYDRMLLRARIRPILQDRLNQEYAARAARERAAAGAERAYGGGRLLVDAGDVTPTEAPTTPPTGRPPIQEAEFEDLAGTGGAPAGQVAAAPARALLPGATPGQPRPVIALPGEVPPRTFEMGPVAEPPETRQQPAIIPPETRQQPPAPAEPASAPEVVSADEVQPAAAPEFPPGRRLIPTRRPGGGVQWVLGPEEPVEEPTAAPAPEPTPAEAPAALHPQMASLVDAIKTRIATGQGWKDGTEFQRFAKEHLGGSIAEGTFEMKDIYDAAETAMNQHLAEIGPQLMREPFDRAVPQLQQLTNLLPTQTVRSTEQNAFQQYSTPPALSYLAATAGEVKPGETVLEPSAGTGSLATWAKAAGAKVETNELAPRRKALLELQGYSPTQHNAEHISDMRPDLKADVVLMNPPFSASAGRLSGNKNAIGFQHVLSALDALKPGGRLVAILGGGRPGMNEGTRMDAPMALPLWKGIRQRGATVRANIGISGKNYQKYGTTFDNRLVIIDKTPPVNQPAPITGDHDTIESAYHAIEPILGRREPLAGTGGTVLAGGPGHIHPVRGEAPRPSESGAGGGGLRGWQRPGREGVQPTPRPEAPGRPGAHVAGEPPPGVEPSGEGAPPVSGPRRDLGTQPVVDIATGKRVTSEDEGTFAEYRPSKLRTGMPHQQATGTGLVETSAMAAVEPPDITYRPSLPKSIIDNGHITDAQLESVVYAGQAHDTKLPNGLRGGYMNGDGTGVGKGTIAAGIVLDNWNKGRKKTLWVSLKSGLVKQAQRDLDWIDSGIKAKMANDWAFGDKIDHEGVVFSSYAMLHQTGADQNLPSRLEQLVQWNPDVIIFDESHAAKNAVGTEVYNNPNSNKKDIFSDEGTKAGQAVLELDKRLPDSRLSYFSATAFTDVRNLGYANRLGLWGQGTDFPTFRDFLVQIDRGGLGAMELVARELKTLGRYTARQISFKGVDYREVEAKLTPAQRQMYDGAVNAWQTILANIDDAIDATTGEGNGQSKGLARMRALKDFWNRNLSFYRQILTTMKVPAVIGEVEKALSEGKSVFIDLVSTGEAEGQRQFSRALQEGTDFSDLDMSAKQMIHNYLDKSFPIYLMEDYEDENGVRKAHYVTDAKGDRVVNQQALQIREQLKEGLDSIKLPKAPIDELIDAFGPDQVAEISGRKSRIVEDPNTGKPIEVKRVKPKGAQAKDVNEWERQNFMSGKKRIAIASGAGGTGFDFHSDKRVANQQRRVHITIEPSWSADAQMQKFGRTHRTNQVIPPEYALVATDLGGEKRFMSAIASRLESQGALTRGERKAAGGVSEILSKYNVESTYGQAAVDAVLGQIDGSDRPSGGGATNVGDVTVRLDPLPAELQQMGKASIQGLLGMASGDVTAPVSRFLNRVVNLPTNVQPMLFDHFMNTFAGIVQAVKDAGTFDEGTLQLKALSTSIKGDEIVRQNPPAPPTRHVTVDAEFPVKYTPWMDASAHLNARRDSPGQLARNRRSGQLWAIRRGLEDQMDKTTGQMVPMASGLNVRGNRNSFPYASLTPENYEFIPREQAKATWESDIAKLPKTEHEDIHIITGSVLGAWKTLSENADAWKIPIVSVRGQGGQPITGVRLPASTAQDTVNMLAGRGDFSPTAIFRKVWDRAGSQNLSGGLRLQRTRMMGETSLTITGGTPEAQRALASVQGLKANQTAAGTRYYIPIASDPTEAQRDAATATLGEVLRLFPPSGMEPRPGTSERGAVTPEFLTAGLANLFNPEGPRSNYSGLGALEDKFVRNLSQLERASNPAHTAAIRAASSRAQAATILRAAVPAIQKALEGSDYSWPELRLALIESRLQGLRDRWLDLADQVTGMSDKDLDQAFTQLNDLLSAIEDKQGLPDDLAQSATALKEAGDVAGLRKFMDRHFREASGAVQSVMDPDWFRDVVRDPQVKDALGVYKNLVERPMAENHALNEGVFSDALGPLKTYYPLIPLERTQPQPPGRRLPYHKPRNIANKFATGLSAGYDATMEAFRDRLTAAVRGNDKAALLKMLEEEGLLSPAAPGQQTFTHNGQVYDGERVEISAARQVIKDGKSFYIPARVGIMPRWLARELRPVLEGQRLDPQTAIGRILQAVNTFALAGPADFVFHSANLFGTLIANTPFLENSLGGKLASAPLLKKFTAMVKVLSTDPTTEESAADLIEMAKVGAVPDRYGSVTFSKRVAEELGAERKRFSFSPLLFGPKGLDVRARLVMWRLAKSINPDATPQQLFHFVNQLGNYVPALQGEIERSLKKTGFSPFFTAGSTMIRNGINAWTGTGPMPKDGMGLRAWQQITGGAIVSLALWALTYKAMTGKYPWQDRRSKLNMIPAPDSLRRSAIGRALWGPGTEPGYLNFGFFNPLVLRGGRALGIPGAYETKMLGGSAGQVMEAAQRDILNAFAHPALGPAARALFVGATGEEPYITGLRDRSGQVGISFYPAIPPKTPAGLPALGARALAAAREANAFYGQLGEATGILGADRGQKGNHYLRMMVDLVAPGAVSNATNPYKRSEMLREQRTGTR